MSFNLRQRNSTRRISVFARSVNRPVPTYLEIEKCLDASLYPSTSWDLTYAVAFDIYKPEKGFISDSDR